MDAVDLDGLVRQQTKALVGHRLLMSLQLGH